jgi:hypothetical protein
MRTKWCQAQAQAAQAAHVQPADREKSASSPFFEDMVSIIPN